MCVNDIYLEIAALRGQDIRNEAAHERMLREAAECEQRAPSTPERQAAYRRLALTILRLDVNTLANTLPSAAQYVVQRKG